MVVVMHQFMINLFFQHVFVAQTGLTRRLAVDLLDKMNNPDNHQHYSEVDDDDLEVLSASFTYTMIMETFALTLRNIILHSQHGITKYTEYTRNI